MNNDRKQIKKLKKKQTNNTQKKKMNCRDIFNNNKIRGKQKK